jgi:hypothetical protein
MPRAHQHEPRKGANLGDTFSEGFLYGLIPDMVIAWSADRIPR